ncbi:MAG: hypothetical protein R6V55_11935 [Desulfovermiculus sp.]
MVTLKQEALEDISNMPDSSNIDDIMYQLYVMDKVRKGRDAVQNGDSISVDKLRKETESCLSMRQ